MLGGKEILRQVENGNITIEPFNEKQIGPNSYDIRLGPMIARVVPNMGDHINTHVGSAVHYEMMNEDGSFWLSPGHLYLASSIERFGSNYFVPTVHGRSSGARHGVQVHLCAGFSDAGWFGNLVFEITNMSGIPLKIWPYDRIAQVAFERIEGEYDLYDSTYQNQSGIMPGKSLAD